VGGNTDARPLTHVNQAAASIHTSLHLSHSPEFQHMRSLRSLSLHWEKASLEDFSDRLKFHIYTGISL